MLGEHSVAALYMRDPARPYMDIYQLGLSQNGHSLTLTATKTAEMPVAASVSEWLRVRRVESVLSGPLRFHVDTGRAKLRVQLAEVAVILLSTEPGNDILPK